MAWGDLSFDGKSSAGANSLARQVQAGEGHGTVVIFFTILEKKKIPFETKNFGLESNLLFLF